MATINRSIEVSSQLRFADIAVTYTADEFHGIYRGKQCHEPDFDEVLLRARAAGCSKIVLTTMTLEGARRNLEVCRAHPGFCYMTLGIHPYHAAEIYTGNDNDLQDLLALGKALLAEPDSPLVAFGEIGVDNYYLERSSMEQQRQAFVDQLEIAVEHFPGLPLFLHARDAVDEFVEIIQPYLSRLGSIKGVVHSFGGSKADMLRLVELGFHISVNGMVFKTEETVDMVRHIPLTHLQLETDAPWCGIPAAAKCAAEVAKVLENAPSLAVARDRRKFVLGQMVKDRNESCLIGRVALGVAGIKGLPIETVADHALTNSLAMFRLDSSSLSAGSMSGLQSASAVNS